MSASNEFKSAFNIVSLKEIYYSSVKFNSAVGIDRINSKVFERQLNQNLYIIRNKALLGIYKFSQYREKLLSRGANKIPRVVSIPTLRDKITLKALFRVLISTYKDEMPFLHQVITEANFTLLQGGFDGALRLDVRDFYPSIHHDILLAQLSKRIRKKEIINLIADSISQQTVSKGEAKERKYKSVGIPQGLSISNVLANVYMLPIDKKYKRRTDLKYYRYVDDILILCDRKNIEQIKKEIEADCYNICLNLHGEDEPTKIHKGAASAGFDYLGYQFNGPLVTVRKKTLDKLRESIIRLMTSYKNNSSKRPNIALLRWSLNLRITGCQFNGVKYGWMFYFSQINDIQLLSSLDHFTRKQLIEFGIDPNIIKVKKFIRAYHEITSNLKNSRYIPNYDVIDQAGKKEILQTVFRIGVASLDDRQINYLFRKSIFRNVKELERDLSRHS